MVQNKIKLFTKGEIKTKDGREFTRYYGGFGENQPIISVKQIAELMGKQLKHVNEVINRNIESFTEEYLMDLKVVVLNDYNSELLKTLGYTNMQVSKSKNIYILSRAGFMLYLKFAEGDKATEMYKDFIEDYFRIEQENKTMGDTLENTKLTLIEQKKYLIGSMIVEQDEIKRMDLTTQLEKLNNQIIEIEKTLSGEKLYEGLKDSITIAEKFTNSEGLYDVGNFAKIIDIKGLGRNKMFEWLRDKKILMTDNVPYQRYSEYFKVIPLEYNGHISSKTLLKGNGVSYIVKKLIKDDRIKTKTYEEIMNELNNNLDKAV